MLKNFKILIFLLIFSTSQYAKDIPKSPGNSLIDMNGLFKKGLLGSLYGLTIIGGSNAVIILMGDDTKKNMYRVKYGLAIGALIGLAYGTAMGLSGSDLIPSIEPATPDTTPKANFRKGVLYTIANSYINFDEKSFTFFTKITF